MNKAIMTGRIAVMFLGLNTAAQEDLVSRPTPARTGIIGGLMCSQR
jgi:hypothetical protein